MAADHFGSQPGKCPVDTFTSVINEKTTGSVIPKLEENIMRRYARLITLSLLLTFATTAGRLVADCAAQLPPGCSESSPEACRYVSDLSYPVGVIDDVVLTDSARDNYQVPLLVRYPIGAAGPRPVVIWNHGGDPSPRGNTRSEEWGTTLAAAGYIVIHPSRVPVEDIKGFRTECKANGFKPPEECAFWLAQMRFGPQTVHFLIDHLTDVQASNPALGGMFDMSRLVVAGHSAGTTSVLAAAGASQQWLEGGPIYSERDSRPIAFLASGPQGPLYAGFNSGFQSNSFVEVDRPFMFITGVGDETGEPSETRTTGWLTSASGNKVLSWDTDPRAVHETMDIHKCDTDVQESHCRWIASAGVAFLDAVVRGRPEAQDWMASNALNVLSRGAIEIHRR